MRIGIGYSENQDSGGAGEQAARMALGMAGRPQPCDLVLLFATAHHEPHLLREAVAGVLGKTALIVGGGAAGTITNDYYGYAGYQVGLAAIWLDGQCCDLTSVSGLRAARSEAEAGRNLGGKLARLSYLTPQTPTILLYDAIDRTGRDLRLTMATPLLDGLEARLGFLPMIIGAGLQGDYICSPFSQWTGRGVGNHQVMALTFGGDVNLDYAIMHGYCPGTGYYTVTKADQQTVLEINGRPALKFFDSILGHLMKPDDYPFLLILGINNGPKWAPFNEHNYAGRLCLGIDWKREGIIMFEPDMVAGTEFQIMYRSFDLDHMKPRIRRLFDNLEGREPVLALYIDCAGRAAGYAGLDLEDALVVQNEVAGRAPLLGIYSGTEIAPINNRPRALDWSGVFCLFSVRR